VTICYESTRSEFVMRNTLSRQAH